MEEDANGLFKIPKSNDTRRLPVGRCETKLESNLVSNPFRNGAVRYTVRSNVFNPSLSVTCMISSPRLNTRRSSTSEFDLRFLR